MKVKEAAYKTWKGISNMMPMIAGVILLVGLINTVIPTSFYTYVFKMNTLTDSLIGSSIGGILAGHPITSYIIGGELLNQGISLTAVTAFIVSWVTIGMVQLPAEMVALGKKFTILRNVTAFFLSILVAIVTSLVVILV